MHSSQLVPTNYKPKKLGDYDYIIDISCNIFYDASNNIIYDISNNMYFYKISYYINYLINCLNNVPIVTENGNYLYLFLIITNNMIPLCKIGYTSNIQNRKESLNKTLQKELKLLAIIPINGEYIEKEFHKYIKNNYKYYIMDYYYPDKTKATEIYKLHPSLILILYNFLKEKEQSNNILVIREKTKCYEIDANKEIELKKIDANKEIELKKIELEQKKIELQLELKKIELEIIKEQNKNIALQIELLKLQQK